MAEEIDIFFKFLPLKVLQPQIFITYTRIFFQKNHLLLPLTDKASYRVACPQLKMISLDASSHLYERRSPSVGPSMAFFF